jgi:hypothetical protein
MLNTKLWTLVCASALCGCANLDSIYRPLELGSNSNAVALDVKQRAIFSVSRVVKGDDGKFGDSKVICAEPSPDALSAYAFGGGLTAAMQGATAAAKTQAQMAIAAAETSGSIGLRTQSIQLLRDGLFSNCLAYLNTAVTREQFYELQRRSQNFTLGLLAIEQLTGAVKADQLALGSTSSAATGGDTEKESAALASAQKNQNDAKTAADKALQAFKDSNAAVAEQSVKVSAAKKKLADLKDPDDATKKAAEAELTTATAALPPLQKDAEAKRIESASASRAAVNADAQIAAAQDSLTNAQMRVRAAASGTAQLVAAGGARGAVTDKVAASVLSIVKAVLESSEDEACWSMYQTISSHGDKASVEGDPILKVFASRCDPAAQKALSKEVAKKPGVVTPQLLRDLPAMRLYVQ